MHDNAVESEPSLSASPSLSSPVPSPLPPPVPARRAVRRLTMEIQQSDPPPPLSPSPAAPPQVWSSRKRRHPPSLTAPSTGWRSMSGRTGHSRGARRSEAGSATSSLRTSPTGRRLTQRRPPPSARINMSRTRTRSTAVSAGAAGDRRLLHASSTGCFMCTWTMRAGSRCVTMPLDS